MLRKLAMAAGMLLALPAIAQTAPSAADMDRLRSQGAQILFWNQAQREANFPAMEKIFPTHIVAAGGTAHPLRKGKALRVPAADVDQFMATQKMAGIIVLQNGKIRLEHYALGYSAEGRWTSFSVAKSFTSTLVGAAIKDGFIQSVDEPVTKYIPELAGSGYDGVTIAQLLTMTSGVKWNESYTDPKSDVAQMLLQPLQPGEDATVAYMRKLPRESAPGEKWVYKTGETNLVGVLVRRATGKSLAAYLSEKIWKPYGMERDAVWMIDPSGFEVGGCCMSVSLRDYARFGQLVLEGGKGVVPGDWFAKATSAHAQTGRPGYGYGYQWWTYPEGRFGAQGIFGQMIYFDPAKRIVIVISSAWPLATDPNMAEERTRFLEELIAGAE